ncbi:MAG TPA: ABC transporter ATP-binding protein [Candidatus Deferrimicrobium sp.]|nr:ABC transporter ATP-binding protein [Candidatus Deferrimicrobium sp.]
MIRVKNLRKQFGDLKAVDGITFDVADGEIFGFLGPNGAGKTTTIRILSCIIKPTMGNAYLNGYNVLDNPMEIRKMVGILTENPCLYERLTPVYNLDFFGKLYEVPDTVRAQRIEEILRRFNLYDRKEEKVETFSKGMKQKLALARSLLHNPKIIFLDEPTSALDPKTAKGVRDYIKELSEGSKHIIFVCTHNLTEAAYLCDRVAVIDHGRIVGIGSPEELSRDIWKGERVEIILKNYNETMEQAIKNLGVIKSYEYQEPSLKIDVEDTSIANPLIISTLVNAGAQIISAEVKKHSLEEVYLNLVRD